MTRTALLVTCCLFVGAACAQPMGPAYKWEMPADQVDAFDGAHVAAGAITIDFQKGRCAPIVTEVGVTGLTIVAPGHLVMKVGDAAPVLDYDIYAAMIRFNPSNLATVFVATNAKRETDPGFAAMARAITFGVFQHCWHSRWDALIPPAGSVSVCHFSQQKGDVNAWDDGKGYGAYCFTSKTELAKGAR